MLLNNAIQGAQRGASLTQRMLAFARRQELKPEAIDVPGLVEGITGLMERSIGPNIRIQTQFSLVLPLVKTDANQLEAALLNLVLNARDAMPSGGVVTIGAAEQALGSDNELALQPGRYVRLWVTDTGEGMDDETLKRAMEPFFTTKGVGKGTGLGLSTVHGLAEQSGGKLTLRSAPGAGATVELWLPVEEGAAKAAPAARLVHDARTSRRPLTILVVDDDRLVLVNTAAMLEDMGHTVVEADSGARAIEVLTQRPSIDLIVTDQAMPGMTGLELASVVRAYRPALPMILASGYAELPSQPDPPIARLSKPFNQAELAEAIRDADDIAVARAGASPALERTGRIG
jgi:CheY-like chemotaxis protein